MNNSEMSPLGKFLFESAADMMRVQCAPIAELPPASMISVDDTTLTVCAWCPQRTGDKSQAQKCINYAVSRRLELSHGLCEVCKEVFFSLPS